MEVQVSPVVELDNVTVRTPEKKALIRDIDWRVQGERGSCSGRTAPHDYVALGVGAERIPAGHGARVDGVRRTDKRSLRQRIDRRPRRRISTG